MESFSNFKRVFDDLSSRASELPEDLGLVEVDESEIYAADFELHETVVGVKSLLTETHSFLNALKAYTSTVKASSETEQNIAKVLKPQPAFENLVPEEVTMAWVTAATVKVSSVTANENFVFKLTLQASDDFHKIKEKYRSGCEQLQKEYKTLRRQVIRMEHRRSKMTKPGEMAKLDAEVQASEPVWRSKGASLKAEAEALMRVLEDYNNNLCHKLATGRPALYQNVVSDVQKLDEFLAKQSSGQSSSAATAHGTS